MPELRSVQTIGLRGELKPGDRALLHSLTQHPGYYVLLDVMERVCNEQQLVLINADHTNQNAVLEEHKKVQFGWQMFVMMQAKVEEEARRFVEGRDTPTPPTYSREQLEQDELLDATRHYDVQQH